MSKQPAKPARPAPLALKANAVLRWEDLFARLPDLNEEKTAGAAEAGGQDLFMSHMDLLALADPTIKSAEIAMESFARNLIMGAAYAMEHYGDQAEKFASLSGKAIDAHPDGTRFNPRETDRERVWGSADKLADTAEYRDRTLLTAQVRACVAKGAALAFEAMFGRPVAISFEKPKQPGLGALMAAYRSQKAA
jgi:hypothetical protein